MLWDLTTATLMGEIIRPLRPSLNTFQRAIHPSVIPSLNELADQPSLQTSTLSVKPFGHLLCRQNTRREHRTCRIDVGLPDLHRSSHHHAIPATPRPKSQCSKCSVLPGVKASATKYNSLSLRRSFPCYYSAFVSHLISVR